MDTRNTSSLDDGSNLNASPTHSRHAPFAGELPGDFAVWIFIFAELLAFGVFFLVYTYARNHHVAEFAASQETLDRGIGTINTLALLASSYFVVRAVHAIRKGLNRRCAAWLVGALAMGGLFLALKGVEYGHKFDAGIDLSTNTFYMFYLGLTFFHFMHVVLGMLVLAYVLVRVLQGGYSAEHHTGVESGASYWHMVDLVWLILFPLVYVIR